MPLIRRCPRCKASDMEEFLEPGRGGRHYALKCKGCDQVISHFEVIDEHTGELIATSAYDGDYKAVRWRKKAKDNLGAMGGRDKEGMAV